MLPFIDWPLNSALCRRETSPSWFLMKFRHATREKKKVQKNKFGIHKTKEIHRRKYGRSAVNGIQPGNLLFSLCKENWLQRLLCSSDGILERIQGWAETRWTQLSDLRGPLLLRNSSLTVTWRWNSNVYRGMRCHSENSMLYAIN